MRQTDEMVATEIDVHRRVNTRSLIVAVAAVLLLVSFFAAVTTSANRNGATETTETQLNINIIDDGTAWLCKHVSSSFCSKPSSTPAPPFQGFSFHIDSSGRETALVNIPGHGPVRGLVNRTTEVITFKNIPFAAAPVGKLRWKPPQPFTGTWKEPRDGTRSGHQCPQVFNTNEPIPQGMAPSFMSEDCLTLDLTIPLNPAQKSLPVMVYLFGGSFTSGGTGLFGMMPLSTENNLISTRSDLIFVLPNYRLNVLGFLPMKELFEEDPMMPTTGNYGFQDQRAAMQWAKKHIKAFGGDPNLITIGGQSAGAISVDAHIASSRTPPDLFSAAFSQSGTPTGQFSRMEDAMGYGEQFKNLTGCDQGGAEEILDCVRRIPWNWTYPVDAPYSTKPIGIVGYQSAVGHFSWRPCLDGYEFPKDMTPLEVVKRGQGKFKGPVLLGNTKHEGTMFAMGLIQKANAAQKAILSNPKFASLLQKVGVEAHSKVEELVSALNNLEFLGSHSDFTRAMAKGMASIHPYNFLANLKRDGDYALWKSVAQAAGDAMLFCPTRSFAMALAAQGNQVYNYMFTWEPKTFGAAWLKPAVEAGLMGSFHQADVYPFFGTMNVPNGQWNIITKCGLVQCDDSTPSGYVYPEPQQWGKLVYNFQDFFVNFVQAGHNPNIGNEHSAIWPLFNTHESRLQVDFNLTVLPGPWTNFACELWDQVDVTALYTLLVKQGVV